MPIDSIYALIREDLDKVEKNLHSFSQTTLIPVPDLLSYALGDMGKRIRPALTLLSGKLNHYDMKLLLPMATAVELLHIATLIHDDTIDGSSIRRSKATINSVWGKETALILGDYLFATSAELVSTTENVQVMRLFAQTLRTISTGELRQKVNSYNANITRQEYFQLIDYKTASLFSMACETGAILSQVEEKNQVALKNYGRNLGIAFQIVDDILDFVGNEKELGKPVGSDLMQGTVTLPAIVFMEMYPEEIVIKEVLQNRDNSSHIKRAVEAISNSPAIKTAYQLAQEFSDQGKADLKELPDGATRQSLTHLSDYVTSRHQ